MYVGLPVRLRAGQVYRISLTEIRLEDQAILQQENHNIYNE